MAALISSVLDDTPKVAEYIAECSRLGIEVVPPHVNVSSERFTARDGKIYFGLLAVKNVGAGFIREIERERKRAASLHRSILSASGCRTRSSTNALSRAS